ncbi:MAG: hypothetical protein AAF840_16450, partial [Bacteroidota bacterium]
MLFFLSGPTVKQSLLLSLTANLCTVYALLLLTFSLTPTTLKAQNIGRDIQFIIEKTANVNDLIEDPAALDKVVATLAYYSGMPDVDRVRQLLSGPVLLDHFQDNQPMLSFLAEEGLSDLLTTYQPPQDNPALAQLLGDRRNEFLKETEWEDLFKEDGDLDLEKIKAVYTDEQTTSFDLVEAAANAEAGNL